MRGFLDQLLHYFDRPGGALPSGPVGGPAAWRGDSMDDSWRLPLNEHQVDELDQLVRTITDGPTKLASLTVDDVALPSFATAAGRWRDQLDRGRGFVVLSGFPVERWTLEQCEAACWIIGLHLGVPGAQNDEGELLGHVKDLGASVAHQDERLYRTNEAIRFHCDAADVVGLLCRSTSTTGGSSRLVSSVTVHDLLRAEHPALADRLFEELLLDARQPPESETPYLPVRPATFDGERLRTFMHLDYFESVTRHDGVSLDEATKATLAAWEEIASRPGVHLDMDLAPGDFQLVSNHSVVHARTAYVDDPTSPRDLLRLWLSLES